MRAGKMARTKIFFGTTGGGENHHTADYKFNQWAKANCNAVSILDVQYQQARMGDHSIFVLYEVVDPARYSGE